MLADMITLRQQMSMGIRRGCGDRWVGVVNRIAAVFALFKSMERDASHTFTSMTQRVSDRLPCVCPVEQFVQVRLECQVVSGSLYH